MAAPPRFWLVKARRKGERRWRFVGSDGTHNLRVFGRQFETSERAEAFIVRTAPLNPDLEFKVTV